MNRRFRLIVRLVAVLLLVRLLGGCGGSDAPTESADAYLFLSPSDVSVAPGQSIEVEFDIANLPTGDAAFGYSISLSEETTRIRIDPSALPCDAGTVSCKRWTIRPDADAPPGDYAYVVRASGTRAPVAEAHARIRVVPIARSERAVKAASAQHLITADGRLWARGANRYGQTGVGFESVGFDPNDPFVLPDFIDAFVQVGTDTDWIAVVSAGETTIALKSDGTVWGWGANPKFVLSSGLSSEPSASYFQLGVSSPRDIQLRPRQLLGLADIQAISAIDVVSAASSVASPSRFLALTRNGTLYGFGGGVGPRYNMRVHGTSVYLETGAPLLVPRSVTDDGTETTLTGIVAIAGGVQNTGPGWALALHADGTVWQMGHRDGSFFNDVVGGPGGIRAGRAMPSAVAGLPPRAVAVAVGELASVRERRMLYSLAATEDGSVWSWTEADSVPQRVTGFTHPIIALDSTFGAVTALDNQGGLWRWIFGTTAPQRVAGVPVMGRLAHRGTQWAISGDCAPGIGRLWDTRDAQRVGYFGSFVSDDCGARSLVTLSLAKVGNGTVSIDPVDGPLDYACGTACAGPLSLRVGQRDALRVRGTPAPGWRGPSYNAECNNGSPLLDADTSCIVTFAPITREGKLSVEVSGAGRVTSTPAGIDCGADCSETYALGTRITLTPVAEPGSSFLRWSGPSHTNERDCRDGTVSMNVVYDSESGYPLKKCIAVFGPLPQLSVAANPGGTVTSTPAGIDCGAACGVPFAAGTQLTLSAAAGADFRFDGFVEAECRGPITLTRDLSCTPVFTSTTAGRLTVSTVGGGSLTSVPPGIDCGNDCSETFAPGSTVTLIALATPGTGFSAWSADCPGGVVVLDVARNCIATFVPAGWQQLGPEVAQGNEQRLVIAVDVSVASMPTIVAATAVKVAARVDLLVRRFDAASSSWTLVGSAPINADALVSSEMFTPAMAIDSGGRITVAWPENGRQLRVKRWEGGAWTILADDLRVDPNAATFGTQISAPGGNLVVAWLETTSAVQGLGRMVMKRYGPGAQTWLGGTVLPAVNNVTALRLSTEAAGNALLMFVPQDATTNSFEGPLRVLREGSAGGWTDVCGALLPPASASGVFSPNGQLGFGIGSLAFPASDPLAVFNNGQSIFALKCRAGGWTSLDGSAQGEVAAVGPGESLWGLAVTPGGAALAWSRARFLTGGGTQFLTQVQVENASSTALAAYGDVLIQDSSSGFGFGGLTRLTFAANGSPVLSGLLTRNGGVASQVFRYVP